jgi:hypothetical protein
MKLPEFTQFRESLQRAFGTRLAEDLPARVGNPVDHAILVDNTDRDGLVYIHGLGSDPQSAYTAINNLGKDALTYDAPVLVRRVVNGYIITSKDLEMWDKFWAGTVMHDQQPVLLSQLMYGTAQPTNPASMQVQVLGALYDVEDTAYRGSDQLSADFSTSPVDVDTVAIDVPTTPLTAIGVCIQIDPTTDTLSYKQGAAFPATLTHKQAFDAGYYPQRDTDRRRITWLRLVTGMTAISYEHLYNAPELLNGGGGSSTDGVQIYYIGKHGNDANSGLTWNDAVLTIGQAHILTAAETPAIDNRFSIVCLDAGNYDEDVTCQSYVDLYMPEATVEGTITGADNSVTTVGWITPDSSTNALQLSASGQWIVDIKHIVLDTSCNGVYCNHASGVIAGTVKRISNAGGASSTVAFNIANGSIRINYNTILTNGVYTRTGGTIKLIGNESPAGTRTGTGYEVTPDRIETGQITLGSDIVSGFETNTTLTPATDSTVPTTLAVKTNIGSVAYIEDQKVQNTAGGTFTSGAWRTRDLNTKVYDTYSICSITKLAFTSGGTAEIAAGNTIEGATSGATATVFDVELTSGSWAGGDAAGNLWLNGQTGTFVSENLDTGTQANIATVAADSTNNEIRLLAGTYRFEANAPAEQVGGHQTRIQNTTDTSTTGIGSTEKSAAGAAYAITRSFVNCKTTIAAAKTFELQHLCNTSRATYGFGEAANLDTEVYSQIKIIKE